MVNQPNLEKIKSRINILLSKILRLKFVVIAFVLFTIVSSLQSLTIENKPDYADSKIVFKRYNNYIIFSKSFEHLKDGKDLYIPYPKEHYDLYKYSPTFAALFSIFSALPNWLGLSLWNLLNTIVLLFAIYYLPNFDHRQKSIILLLVVIELITSLQNSQSNGLIVGFLILAFGLLEKKKYFWASFSIILTVFIKLFGIVGLVLFLFYPKKWELILYSFIWSVILFTLPLIFIDVGQYMILLESYLNLLSSDGAVSNGFSVMGWLNSWFGIHSINWIILLIGIITFLLPLYKFRAYSDYRFRLLTLSSILIWVGIFNHKAESPTFVIAMTGCSIWFVNSKKNTLNIILFTFAFILTTLSPTNLFPRFLREEYVTLYALKVFPCILIWLKIIYDMIILQKREEINDSKVGILS